MKGNNTFYLILTMLIAFPAGLWAQHEVSGQVLSTEGSEPLIGVNIMVKNTTTGTITDYAGNYELTVPSANDTLTFSYTGYTPVDVAISGRTTLDVTMSEATELLSEVVVIGYGVQKKSDLTGAVATVNAEELNNIPTSSLAQALQGKVAGVQVTPQSGSPGAGAVIRIRGIGTLNDADPLFVVDGMIVSDINYVNPQDVENVSILKDASATAIYGARGANGVVIITTKKGKIGQEGQVNVTSYYGTQEVIRTIDLANATEYATLANELAVNEGRAAPFDNPEAFGEGTDWQDVIFESAPIQSHQISISGGSEKSTYSVSANLFDQTGIMRGGDFRRLTLRINNDYRPKDFITLGHNVGLIRTESTNGPGILLNGYRTDPITPPIDSAGEFGNTSIYSSTGNAEASIFYNNNESEGYRAVGNVYLDIKFLQNFTFRTNFGLDYRVSTNKSFVPVFEVSAIQQNRESTLNVGESRTRNWLWENTLTYNKDWVNHHVDALVGLTSQDNFGENLGGSRKNFLAEIPEQFFLNAGEQGTETNFNGPLGNQDWGIVSYLFRVNYTFADRYLFTFSSRLDGSSRFGKNFQYGFFPSVGLGWNLTNEDFMADQALFSRLKLRASWGQTGNDQLGRDFGFTPLVTSNLGAVFGPNETLYNGATALTLANPDLRWEETTQMDIGVEMGFLDNRLLAEIDYYNRTTNDILFNPPIPDYVGANSPFRNVAEVLNRGFDIGLNWRNSGKFSYHFGAVLSTIYNEVLQLDGSNNNFFAGGLIGGQLATNSRRGLAAGSFWGYQTDGVFQNEAEVDAGPTFGDQVPGDLRFVDVNGDGIITPDDRTVIGKPTPDFIFGLNAGFEIMGFDFLIEFNGQTGADVINQKRMSRFGLYNFESIFLDRWNSEGTSNTEPRVTTSGINYEFSDRFVQSADFIRLRNLQIGYNFPRTILQKLRMTNLRIYLSGTNLVTWQEYSGYTPEISNSSIFGAGIDRGVYPLAKTYLVGLNLTF